MPEFSGLKISQDAKIERRKWGVQRVRVRRNRDQILTDHPGEIGWSGNSGFHAVNLAVQFGAEKIILVGYDMTLDHGVHWHGPHRGGLNNPRRGSVERWRRVLDEASIKLMSLGVQVINASPISALTAYPKMSLSEALACCD